ncbi:hypothetical protein KIW84_024877 [Lathyrus oleraceus]|uniref:PB1-like domain-containing protein n=1 Tax=Pisum sativum TaxID=3888 RepID=A0A9D4YIY9_PEA|nr:hypothetical protein KIW84_024877 [Pisum sativum]
MDDSNYGGSVSEVKCDVDKWSYFEVLGIVKELEYEESGTVIYRDPTVGLFTLSDDKGAQEIVDLCKVHKSVHLWCNGVEHMSEGEVEDINVNDNGAKNMSEGEVVDNNLDVNGVEDMSESEVGDNNVDVNGVEDMSDSDDVSF